MIVGSLLLILVAVGLLVAGVLGGSNLLIICCIVVVILAAIVLVLGVKQSAAAGLAYGVDIDIQVNDATSEYPAVVAGGSRVRRPDRRINEDTAPVAAITSRSESRLAAAPTAEYRQVVVEEPAGATIPSQGTDPDPFGDVPARRSYSELDDESYDSPIGRFDDSAHAELMLYDEVPAYDAYDDSAVTALDGADGRAVEVYDGAVDGAFDAAFDGALDEDPPDEPSTQMVSPSNAAQVAMLSTDVLVVDGRPRYHLSDCVHLLGRETEPLPVGEAVELGFTPCALCEPDSALLAGARPV